VSLGGGFSSTSNGAKGVSAGGAGQGILGVGLGGSSFGGFGGTSVGGAGQGIQGVGIGGSSLGGGTGFSSSTGLTVPGVSAGTSVPVSVG
jgi:hypothetical protein